MRSLVDLRKDPGSWSHGAAVQPVNRNPRTLERKSTSSWMSTVATVTWSIWRTATSRPQALRAGAAAADKVALGLESLDFPEDLLHDRRGR